MLILYYDMITCVHNPKKIPCTCKRVEPGFAPTPPVKCRSQYPNLYLCRLGRPKTQLGCPNLLLGRPNCALGHPNLHFNLGHPKT